jgi:hypothetical protein
MKHKKIMKKLGVMFWIILFVFVFATNFVLAENCTSFNYTNWSSCSGGIQTRTVINASPINCTGGFPSLTQNCSAGSTTTVTPNLSSIDKAFSCLESRVGDNCNGATTLHEVALTILASPKKSVIEGCYNKLKTYDKGNCFGTNSCNVKETALGILAYNHLRQDTANYRAWVLNQTLVSTEIQWFLQQDSIEASNCKITYDSTDYSFLVQANKKIDQDAGFCLSLANSNYWFALNPACYGKEFALVCDKAFIGNLLYKQPNSPIVYVLSNTQSSVASGTINVKVKSKCFGKESCDYEATAWAAVALKNAGTNVDEFVPYLVASAENNKQYLPYAFLNMLVDYSEYGTKLVQMQNLNAWEAENTVYDRYYDTALALISLTDSSATAVKNSRDWLTGYAQETNGCWNNNNVRDTAIILWALQHRQSTFVISLGVTLTTCSEGNFFCTSDCPSEQIKQNYAGCSAGKTCCGTQNLKTCAQLYGEVCVSGKVCDGDSRSTADAVSCCLGSCVEPQAQQNACEIKGGVCKTSCNANQNQTSQDCNDASMVCCEKKTTLGGGTNNSSSLVWLWILLVILIILVILAIIFREKIKLWWYKMNSKFKKEDGEGATKGAPFGPSAPGMMPMQRSPMMRPGMPPAQMPPGQRKPLPMQPLSRGLPPKIEDE